MLFVSTNKVYRESVLKRFPDAKVLSSLDSVDLHGVKTFIFHSCSDDISKVSLTLSHILGKIPKCIYLNDNLDSVICTLFIGVAGDIYDTELALEDLDVLEYYIDSYGETGDCFNTGSIDVDRVKEAFDFLSTAEPSEAVACLKNADWLAVLDEAISGCKQLAIRSTDVGKPIHEILNKSWEVIDKLRKSNDEIEEEFTKLTEEYQKALLSSGSGTEVYVFPSYQVPVVCRTFYVKVLSPCAYLNSFMDAFQSWYRVVCQKNTRCLIITPNLKQYLLKYKDIPNLNSNSINKGVEFWSNPWFVTHKPTFKVLNDFFNKPGKREVDSYIVIDLTFADIMLKGNSVMTYYAVGSTSDLRTFGIPKEKTFIPIVRMNNALSIPRIPNYSYTTVTENGKTRVSVTSDSMRRTSYLNNCESLFNLLANLLDG